jgi:CubicO group peptidase (beta-lactamase class C family)
MSEVGGTVAPGYEAIRGAFADAQKDDEGGAQLAVYRHGKKVVDLWTGRDKLNNRAYGEDTISVLMSCSKGMTATMAHMLVERGQIDVDERVAKYWPEFAQAGKDDVRVRHLLSHTVGLTSFEKESGVGPKELLDWKRCINALEQMTPLWEPGTAVMYHAVTYGYLVGEVIRRVSGKMPGKFFADEIAAPLGLDLWIGLPEREEHRVAPHFSSRPAVTLEQWAAMASAFGIDLNSRVAQTMINMFVGTGEAIEMINRREGHAAQIPAANGIGTARALAKMYAATIGEVDGVRLLKAETVSRARAPQTDSLKGPLDFAKIANPDPQRIALGYELNRRMEPMLGDGSFGHAGAGGRLGFAHPETGTAVGYVCNNMLWDGITGPDARWMPWTQVLEEIVFRNR